VLALEVADRLHALSEVSRTLSEVSKHGVEFGGGVHERNVPPVRFRSSPL
jgi:hypothetical protein